MREDKGLGCPLEGAGTAPRISLCVPAYNEEKYLPKLLDSVALARERYRLGADRVEVVVGDNASTDATAAVAKAYGCKVVPVEERRISVVRNRCAAVAKGEIFAFADADMQLHPDTFNVIDDVMAGDKYIVGATGAKMDRLTFARAFTQLFFLPANILIKFDTGVIFCRREDFYAVGGFNEKRRWQEDFLFYKSLRLLGKSRGQRYKLRTRAKAIYSTRKWDKFGEWHVFTRSAKVLYLFVTDRQALLARKDEFIGPYWYDDPPR